jgi:hypothetical protein
LAASLGLAISMNAQTLYVPGGTSGIGTSANGNVGIGTNQPLTNFDINGDNMYITGHNGLPQYIANWSSPGVWGIGSLDDGKNSVRIGAVYHPSMTWNTSLPINIDVQGSMSLTGNFGIGTISPTHPLTIKPNTDIDAISWQRSIDGYEVGRLGVTGGNGTGRYGWIGLWNATGSQSVQIDAGGGNSFINSGNVGIGTTSPQNKLDVNGTIHAKEVKVDLTGWSDFVFAPAFKLKPLGEVEQYIKANGHLPEIPSATEVEQNGVNVGDMQAKLLQKVEELTLYTIEQDKKIKEQDRLKAEVEVLNQNLADLTKQNSELKQEIEQLKLLITQKLKP